MQLLKLSVQIFLSVGWGDWNHPQSHQICRTVFNLRRESRTENWYIFSFWLRSLCSAGLWNVCGKICLAELDELLSRYARYTVKNSFFFAIYLRIHSVCVFFFTPFLFLFRTFFSLCSFSQCICVQSLNHMISASNYTAFFFHCFDCESSLGESCLGEYTPSLWKTAFVRVTFPPALAVVYAPSEVALPQSTAFYRKKKTQKMVYPSIWTKSRPSEDLFPV